jgi:phosphonoacetaldehyde hydrolase
MNQDQGYQCLKLRAIVFDWAGTTIDFGSCAPAAVFQRVFEDRGVEITAQQAREPMGMAKREHIRAISAMPEVASAWQTAHGRPISEADIDSIYKAFIPLQLEIISDYSTMIAGAAEAIDRCRGMGLKIGSSTGYTHQLMEVVAAEAKKQGYVPDVILCSEDAPRGRPAPYLLWEIAKRLDVYPMSCIVKVDDTPVGVQAGRNAGCWTVGVTRTGNCVGLSPEEFDSLELDQQSELCARADRKLRAAGAHHTVQSIAEIPAWLIDLDRRIVAGAHPDVG